MTQPDPFSQYDGKLLTNEKSFPKLPATRFQWEFCHYLSIGFLFTPGVPFKPFLQDVIDVKCGEYNASWETPAFDSGGGPTTAYQAQVRMQSEDWWRDCTTSLEKRSCVFRGLVNQTKYHVRVQAINRKGPSDWYYGSFDAVYAGTMYTSQKKKKA